MAVERQQNIDDFAMPQTQQDLARLSRDDLLSKTGGRQLALESQCLRCIHMR